MTPKIDLQTELAKRQICICGIVFRAPANVIDEVSMLLKQSKNTKIQYCIASFDASARFCKHYPSNLKS